MQSLADVPFLILNGAACFLWFKTKNKKQRERDKMLTPTIPTTTPDSNNLLLIVFNKKNKNKPDDVWGDGVSFKRTP